MSEWSGMVWEMARAAYLDFFDSASQASSLASGVLWPFSLVVFLARSGHHRMGIRYLRHIIVLRRSVVHCV